MRPINTHSADPDSYAEHLNKVRTCSHRDLEDIAIKILQGSLGKADQKALIIELKQRLELILSINLKN